MCAKRIGKQRWKLQYKAGGLTRNSHTFVAFRVEKRSAQASAHPLSQAQGGLFCVFTVVSLFDMFACFSSLENYFGFRTTNVKGKTDHSVSLRWNKRLWTFLKRRVFLLIVHPINLWVDLKPACIQLLVVTVTFFTCPDLLPLQNQLYLCLQSKNHIAVIMHQQFMTGICIRVNKLVRLLNFLGNRRPASLLKIIFLLLK